MTWRDFRIPSTPGIYFNRSLDGGATWLESDVRVSRDTASTSAGLLAISGSSVYVTWHRGTVFSGDVFFNRSLDGGITWFGSDMRVNTHAATSSGHDLAASGASVYVVWGDLRNDPVPGDLSLLRDTYFNRSLDGGATWLGSDVRLNTDAAGSANSLTHQIAAFGSAVFVTWADTRNGERDIYFNRSLSMPVPHGSYPTCGWTRMRRE